MVHVTHIPVLDVFVEIIVFTSLIDFLHVADLIIVIKNSFGIIILLYHVILSVSCYYYKKIRRFLTKSKGCRDKEICYWSTM